MSLQKSQNQHLSEEALNDLLIGAPAPDAESHLAVCAECREQVARFRSDLALFNEATLTWSRQKASSMPPVPHRSRLLPAHPLAWGAATAALLVAMVAGWNHQHAPTPAATDPATDPSVAEFADSPDQIAEDNQLLRNVYDALDEEPGAPVNDFSIVNGSSSPDALSKARTQ